MIVCHCRALSDRDVREAVRRGEPLPAAIDPQGHCGGCRPLVEQIVRAERAACRSRAPAPAR